MSSSYHERKVQFPDKFLQEMQNERNQLLKIKEQQLTVSTIDQTLKRQNSQIVKLNSALENYKQYYEKYQGLKGSYTDKASRLAQKQKEVEILLKEVEELLAKNSKLQQRLQATESEREELIKQQHQIEVVLAQKQKFNIEIEETFQLYRKECKNKEKELLVDLQKAYKQITELNKRIDGYQMQSFENQQLKKALEKQKSRHDEALASEVQKRSQLEKQNSRVAENMERTNLYINMPTSTTLEKLTEQINSLRTLLGEREKEVAKYKMLNNELTLEFDHAVNKICEFERQLSEYRRQNHELKKTVGLFMQKEQYEKMHLEHLKRQTGEDLEAESQQSSERKQMIRDDESEEDSEYEKQIARAMYGKSDPKFGSGRKQSNNKSAEHH